MNNIQHTVLPLIEQFSSYAAFIAFFSAFGETLIGIGWFLPGSTILLIMGVLAGQGYLNIVTVMIFGILGAWLGDSVNYQLGKRYGLELLQKPQLHLPASTIEKAHAFLNSHGAKSVFFSRFLPGLKETVPFLAGSVQMDRRKFLIWNFLGAIGWSFEFIATGYLFSSSLALAQAWMDRSAIVIATLVGVIVILWLLKRFLQTNIPTALLVFAGIRKGFMQSRPVQRFIAKHPKIIAFISERFNHNRFTGFPLTLLVLSFGYVLILFGGIIEDFLSKDSIIYVDHIIANLMYQWRTDGLINFFTWITYLGREPVVATVILLVVILFLLYRRYNDLIAFFISISGSLIFLWLGKLAFHRPRPNIALYFEHTYSFPSGHATIAVSLYGFLGYLLIHYSPTLRTKLNIFFTTTILIFAIGFSRIYLGEHYLSDVYAGFLLGTLWVIIGITLFKWIKYRSIFTNKQPMQYSKAISSLLLVSVSISLLVYLYKFPYRYAIHKPVLPVAIKSLSHYFSDENNRFTRNLIGLQSRPISIIVSGKINPCRVFQKRGWHKMLKTKLTQPPIFWHAHEPLCRLSKKSNDSIYLTDIWQTNLHYNNTQLYVIASDALVGKQWDIIPLYSTNLPKARDYTLNDLIHTIAPVKVKTITLAPPAIRKHFNTKEYFDDGKAVVVIEKKR